MKVTHIGDKTHTFRKDIHISNLQGSSFSTATLVVVTIYHPLCSFQGGSNPFRSSRLYMLGRINPFFPSNRTSFQFDLVFDNIKTKPIL